MAFHHSTRTADRSSRWTSITLPLILGAGFLGAGAFLSAGLRTSADGFDGYAVTTPHGDVRQGAGAPLSEADGLVPEGTTVFDGGFPAVENLAPDLYNALRMATSDAADSGVGIMVTSGWRSRQYQEHLLQDAVLEYGSAPEAARWVATADTSSHVSGDAVDVGPAHAAAWLSEYGAGYGLCRIYANEPWHFELRPDARYYGCPAQYGDPREDPRLQQYGSY